MGIRGRASNIHVAVWGVGAVGVDGFRALEFRVGFVGLRDLGLRGVSFFLFGGRRAYRVCRGFLGEVAKLRA